MEDSINIGLICDEVVPRIPEGHTHLLIVVRSKNYGILYRLTDGMYQGEISDKMALVGENPNKRESRLFCSHEFGLNFVRSLAKPTPNHDFGPDCKFAGEQFGELRHKINCSPVNIYEYDYDSAHTIAIPGSVSLDLAVNGSGARLKKLGGKLH